MKIIINNLITQSCIEIDLDENAKIKDLRDTIAAKFRIPNKFHLSGTILNNDDKKKICVIYAEKLGDALLLDFIRSQIGEPKLPMADLTINVLQCYKNDSSFFNPYLSQLVIAEEALKSEEKVDAVVPSTPSKTKSSCTIQ